MYLVVCCELLSIFVILIQLYSVSVELLHPLVL